MKRHLLNLLTVLSLLLCLGSVTAWAAGGRQVSRVSGAVLGREWSAAAARGRVYCFFSPDPGRIYRRAYAAHPLGTRCEYDQPPSRVGVKHDRDVLPERRKEVREWGLGVTTVRGSCGPCVIDVEGRSAMPPRWKTFVATAKPAQAGPGFCRYRRFYAAAVPLWPTVLVFALLPTAGAFRLFRARRLTESGHCAACGYDLRATPDRFPECGAIPAPTRDPSGCLLKNT